jgi:peptide/nickel transport system substrate-binding protein
MFKQLLKKFSFFQKTKKEKHKIIPTWKQLKYLNQVLSQKEKKLIKLFSLIIIVCLVLLIGRFYFAHSEIVPQKGGRYIEGLVGQPKFINPVLAVDETDLTLVNLIFSGLLKLNQNSELQPDLVKSFVFNPEQKEHIFCLKENVYWHDGEKLDIEDILFTFSLIKNPVFKSPLLEKIKNIQINQIDENCFQVAAENSSITFWSNLTFGILPEHIWGKIKPENFTQSEFNLKPVGTGPYKFASLARNLENKIKLYDLIINEKFYDQSPFIKDLVFSFYSDFDQALEMLKNQEIEGLNYSSKQLNQDLSFVGNFKYYQFNLPYYTAVFLNLRDFPIEEKINYLQEKSVRKALAYLTPKQEIFSQVFNEQGIVIHGPILPYSAYYNPKIKTYNYEPTTAENLLTMAGWRKNTDFYEKNNKILEISLTTVDQPDFVKTAQLIQKSWQNIGLKVKLIIVPPEQIKEIIKNRNFQAFLYGVLENYNPDPFFLWHSSQIYPPGLNLTAFNYRRSDELLEKSSLAQNQEEKRKYYHEFQEIIVDNVPAIFLYNQIHGYLVDQKIKGIEINFITHPADRFNNIENWYIKTRRQLNKITR